MENNEKILLSIVGIVAAFAFVTMMFTTIGYGSAASVGAATGMPMMAGGNSCENPVFLPLGETQHVVFENSRFQMTLLHAFELNDRLYATIDVDGTVSNLTMGKHVVNNVVFRIDDIFMTHIPVFDASASLCMLYTVDDAYIDAHSCAADDTCEVQNLKSSNSVEALGTGDFGGLQVQGQPLSYIDANSCEFQEVFTGANPNTTAFTCGNNQIAHISNVICGFTNPWLAGYSWMDSLPNTYYYTCTESWTAPIVVQGFCCDVKSTEQGTPIQGSEMKTVTIAPDGTVTHS